MTLPPSSATPKPLFRADGPYPPMACHSELISLAIDDMQAVAFFLVDPLGVIISWNTGAERLLGYGHTEVIGRQAECFFPEIQALEQALQEADTSGKVQTETQMELLWNNRQGLPRWTDTVVRALRDNHGALLGYSYLIRDIGSHKQNEEKLQQSEWHFRQLVNNAPVFIWMADLNAEVTYANQTWQDFTGKSFAGSLGLAYRELLHPDDLVPTMEKYATALATRQPWHLICRLRRTDGQYRWLQYSAVPQLSREGQFKGFMGIGLDITERKQAEEALKESESRFRIMADVSPIMIWMNDAQANLSYANKALLAFFGLPLETVGNRGWEPYIHPDDLAKVREQLAYAFDSYTNFDMELRMKRADGQFRWLRSMGAPRFSEDAQFMGQVGTCMDITESREMNEELESRVHQRTRQLETLNHELEAFAYSVSHDLRAPLRSIDGFSRLLLTKTRDRLNEEEQRYLQNVCENTQRMGELIDDLLKLSRLSRAEMVYETVDLGEIARKILADRQQQEPQRHVNCQVAESMVVQGDTSLLTVLMENLLGNAWKFTGRVPNAEIEVGKCEQAGTQVYYIRDNGAGFNMKYADKLFGAFQRLHRMDEFPGTGIGLATVQRIINRHGGKVWAEGEINRGATFYFSL